MTLDKAKKGSEISITGIDDAEHRSQLVRLGISEGSRVVCQEKLPFGPIVLRCNRQEIAIGRKLAKSIRIDGLNGTDSRRAET